MLNNRNFGVAFIATLLSGLVLSPPAAASHGSGSSPGAPTNLLVTQVYWNTTTSSVLRPVIRVCVPGGCSPNNADVGSLGYDGRQVAPERGYIEFEWSATMPAIAYNIYLGDTLPAMLMGHRKAESSSADLSNQGVAGKWQYQTSLLPNDNESARNLLTEGYYYLGVQELTHCTGSPCVPTDPIVVPADDASSRAGLGSETNPIVFPTVASPTAPSSLTASHGNNGITLSWRKAAARHSSFDIFYKTSTGVTDSDNAIRMSESDANCQSPFAGGATTHDRDCTATIAYADLTDIDSSNHGYFALSARVNGNASGLSGEFTTQPPAPTVSDDGRTITFTQGATSTAENRVCAPLPTIMDGEGELTHDVSNLPDWLEHRSDNGQQLCVKIGAEFAATVTTAPHISVTYRVSESGGAARQATATITIRVNALPPLPAASGGGGSSGAIALVAVAAGAYFWWKKRQIANGNAAAMAFLPDVDFDLDRNDNRAFYTKMNWQNPGGSNWQLRSNLRMHTKYDGKLLDWHANSHIGYRLNGKFGEFNPYLRGKFVQNDPENAEMEETYTLGVNYAIPNRFSVQFLQPDDEIWRYSLRTEVQLPRGVSLRFNQPNSDIWRYSTNLNWQISERIGLNLSQPSSDLATYVFGVQWQGASRIRYEMSGETANRALKLRGSFSF